MQMEAVERPDALGSAMSFDPASLIAAAEAARAKMHVMIYEDGTRELSTWVLGVDWERMPELGALTGDRLEALIEELWQQRKYVYTGPAPRPPRAP